MEEVLDAEKKKKFRNKFENVKTAGLDLETEKEELVDKAYWEVQRVVLKTRNKKAEKNGKKKQRKSPR